MDKLGMTELGTYTPENFLAGNYPIEKTFGTAGAAIAKYEAVSLSGNELVPTTDPEDVNLYGIAAEEAEAGKQLAVYLTGDFYASAIVLQDGVTVDAITPAFRKLGIFLK